MASDRFNYDYPEHELHQLVPNILALERHAEMGQVIFSNHYEDQGQRNASTLMSLLGMPSPVGMGQPIAVNICPRSWCVTLPAVLCEAFAGRSRSDFASSTSIPAMKAAIAWKDRHDWRYVRPPLVELNVAQQIRLQGGRLHRILKCQTPCL